MMAATADPWEDLLQPVQVAGGHFGQPVPRTQIVNRNTPVSQHGVNADALALPAGQFRLNSQITVYENNPINRDSRIYHAKLHSEILDDLKIVVKILTDGERQRREARMHFRIPNHKNIVERILTDTFKYQGQSCIYIAMEQCDPQNLHAYVVSLAEKNAPYDANLFMSLASQIATGLEFLHRHKILNRDLKPENILLSAEKKIAKIADFGMSKEMTDEASTVSTLQPGTDGWRSPEILQKVERITPASDVFSLGLIFHFLWSFGKHAFGDDPHAWNLYIKQGTNMTLDGLKIPNANDAKRLLRSLLSQNPAERPSAREVLRDGVFKGPGLQSDSAGIVVENVRQSATSNSEVRKVEGNRQRFGLKFQTLAHDFSFGKEWKGQLDDQKVSITQYNKQDREKYENAVGALNDLKHGNIVHFIKNVPEICVIVTEFCEGTIKDYLQADVKLSVRIHMATQIASGMDFLHQNTYIHCDLRAENIVVANSICKLAGLSLTRHAGRTGIPSLKKYPIRWSAQELLEGRPITFKSDVWSFGVVLWEIFTSGQEPYPGMQNKEVGESVCVGYRMPKPKQCPNGVYFDIMRPCWYKNPEDRPTFECMKVALPSYEREVVRKNERMNVCALYDYTAVEEDYLSFKKGDVIVNCTDFDGIDWWYGVLGDKMGLFRSKFVVQIRSQKT